MQNVKILSVNGGILKKITVFAAVVYEGVILFKNLKDIEQTI
jgi:hypothetical protein